MMQDTLNASDEISRRRRALAQRIAALPDAGLTAVEAAVAQAEATVPPVPGAQRIVAGATITERPDLAYAAAAAGTIQAPEPEHLAELAKVGPAVR